MPRSNVRANRYSQAIFALARDSDNFESWGQALDAAAALLADRPTAQLLTSPVVTPERKHAVLGELLPGLPAEVANFLDILARRDRLALLPDIATQFRRLVNEHRGIEVVQVTTAVPLDDRQLELIAGRLSARTGKKVALETRVDPAIVGGVTAQFGDDVIDSSVRGRLSRLRQTLMA